MLSKIWPIVIIFILIGLAITFPVLFISGVAIVWFCCLISDWILWNKYKP